MGNLHPHIPGRVSSESESTRQDLGSPCHRAPGLSLGRLSTSWRRTLLELVSGGLEFDQTRFTQQELTAHQSGHVGRHAIARFGDTSSASPRVTTP